MRSRIMKEKILKYQKPILLSWGVIVTSIAIVLGLTFFLQKGVVAEVNGDKISKDELYSLLNEQYGEEILDAIISEKLIEQEAKEQNISVTDAEIEEELQLLYESYGGEEAFNAAMETNGVTKDQINQDLETYIITNKILEPRVKVTEDEMKSYFEENKDTFTQQEQVQASHILVADEAAAKEVKDKLANGGDFSELAKEYSTDTETKDAGGDLGLFGKGDMVAEFEEAAFSMELNTISEPIKTDYGYHIIKVVDKKAAAEAVYEDHEAEIKETLTAEKMNTEYSTWLEEKMEKATIEKF